MDIKDFARLLFRAIRCSDTELIVEILKYKESKKLMNFKDDLGRTPIEYAVVLRDIHVIKFLFQQWPMLYSRALLKAVDVGSIEGEAIFYTSIDSFFSREIFARKRTKQGHERCAYNVRNHKVRTSILSNENDSSSSRRTEKLLRDFIASPQ